MSTANTLDEAMDWFLSHATGSILCKSDSKEKICHTFPEAKSFYEAHPA